MYTKMGKFFFFIQRYKALGLCACGRPGAHFMWISKYPKQIWECPTIETYYSKFAILWRLFVLGLQEPCDVYKDWTMWARNKINCHQASNIRCTLVGIKIIDVVEASIILLLVTSQVDNADVVGAPPVSAAPTTSSFLT